MGSSGRAVKNTRIGFFKTAVRMSKIGHPDGTRATSLSSFFWRGVFGWGSRREFRRASWVSSSATRVRTVNESVRTGFVPISILHFELHFVHEHYPIHETNSNDDMMWFVLFVCLFFIRQLGLLSDLVLAN